ncbi:3-hydroxyacyl-CoA dehydrogenase family protein [Flavitalea sp. BT771]|uniref:3-hydroxyacyl-CoA dehydrogenase family protein n=1 Tax=Flavitalea sp. BT771 TaxID=3063329 RepID=UPI0026E43C45|nr:3-hydroxyacyl-CoA dehydrogenase family protein [Flavitalea sp. BT771]MDO6434241.1 3-hydroxyacyl-CoA dehydrogenase family protein [Flavitalea sp. BT771]MDV6223141.1 3-hydroxyacyl-CoA dehydrogenase family protein [Flavitalea sp. BT771]
MKIAVIAGKTEVKEWLPGKLPSGWECVWVDDVDGLEQQRDAHLFMDMAFAPDEMRIHQLSRLLPAPVMINSVVHTLQEIGQPFIRINAWPGMLKRNIHELAMTAPPPDSVQAFYKQLDLSYRIVSDVAGMVSARILAMIINEAYYTLQEDVSTKEEIDTAMKLGTNYPFGPFEWSELIGLKNIYDLLNKLGMTDNRYLPATAMKEALVGLKCD